MNSHRFYRDNRLLKRSDFLRVYEHGCRGFGRTAVVFCLKREDEGPWRLGLTTTRKIGNAVRRNRARRLTREFFRQRQASMPCGWDLVINLRSLASRCPGSMVDRDLVRILNGLGFTDVAETVEKPGP